MSPPWMAIILSPSTPRANMMLTTQEINEQHRYIAESDVMLMQLETNIEALTEFIRLGKQENKMIMLNPAPIRNR